MILRSEQPEIDCVGQECNGFFGACLTIEEARLKLEGLMPDLRSQFRSGQFAEVQAQTSMRLVQNVIRTQCLTGLY